MRRTVRRMWWIVPFAALFAASQAADFLTYLPAREINPVVMMLPDSIALAVKWLLVVYVCSVTAALLLTGRYLRVIPVILGLGTAIGIVGAVSNIIAQG